VSFNCWSAAPVLLAAKFFGFDRQCPFFILLVTDCNRFDAEPCRLSSFEFLYSWFFFHYWSPVSCFFSFFSPPFFLPSIRIRVDVILPHRTPNFTCPTGEIRTLDQVQVSLSPSLSVRFDFNVFCVCSVVFGPCVVSGNPTTVPLPRPAFNSNLRILLFLQSDILPLPVVCPHPPWIVSTPEIVFRPIVPHCVITWSYWSRCLLVW